jgi:hypothetical protein
MFCCSFGASGSGSNLLARSLYQYVPWENPGEAYEVASRSAMSRQYQFGAPSRATDH